MAKLYLVWNTSMKECVGFLDKKDADYTATGNRRFLRDPFTPTLGDAFRGVYGDDVKRLPQTVEEIDLP